MALTRDQVRLMLNPDEPNYVALARRGAEILPHLRELIQGGDPHYAVKAAYLATLIDDDRAAALVRTAAASGSAVVRAAAASGLRHTRRAALSDVVMTMLGDADPGIRKLAIKASIARRTPELLARVAAMSTRDPSPAIRALASRVASGGGGTGIA
jgi:hypothetical protein